MQNERMHTAQSQHGQGVVARALVRFLLLLAFFFAIPFVAAGRLDWWQAWLLVGHLARPLP